MAPSTDKVIAQFPHKTIPPVVGTPTYETIHRVHVQLNANAASVPTTLGDGALGMLGLTITPAEYRRLSTGNVSFTAPVNPGLSPPIDYTTSTEKQINALTAQHDAQLYIWETYSNCERALKALLISVFDDMYIKILSDSVTGFAKIKTMDIFTHLYDTYGDMTPASIASNDEKLRAPYDGSTPIESFFTQIQDAKDYAVAAKSPYDENHLLAIAANTLSNSGIMNEACREWRMQPGILQSWISFKTFFAKAYRDYQESAATTAERAGYSAAVATFQQMHAARAQDRDTVLTLQLALENLQNQVSSLTNQPRVQPSSNRPSNNRPARATQYRQRVPPAAPSQTATAHPYCWTHGYRVSHSSTECQAPGTGHQRLATFNNPLGGSTKGYRHLFVVDPPAPIAW